MCYRAISGFDKDIYVDAFTKNINQRHSDYH